MAPTLYAYMYPADFPALVTQAPNPGELAEIITFESGITIDLDHINVGIIPGECDIWFVDPLPAPDLAALDAIIAQHTGVRIVIEIKGTTEFADLVSVVVEDLDWQPLCGVLTTPAFFADDLSQLFGRVMAEHMGDGGELRVVESVDGEPDVVMCTLVMPDSGGLWRKIKVDTAAPPRNGLRNLYRVEARRNGAAACSLRYGAISMLRAIIGT